VRRLPELRERPIRIVAMGGGTGLSTLLRGLKGYVSRKGDSRLKQPISDLAAIVTVTDDGGSSGRLRREYRVLPPGDIRNCLVALSTDEALLGRLFQYRFPAGRALAGHSFGNLFLTALTNVTGDFPEAVRLSAKVLAIRGRIFPATTDLVTLKAELEDGRHVSGETNISKSKRRIRHVYLSPGRAKALPEALEAIRTADLILIGPGSLYTSIIPNLLVEGVTETLMRSRATRVYIANLMTQPGETQDYSVADHVRAIYEHSRSGLFHWVVTNRTPIAAHILRRYRKQGAEPVNLEEEGLDDLGIGRVNGDFLQQEGVVRHDADRLTRLLLKTFVQGASRS
jgi:uncharacterized cofD-like protein